MGAFLGCYGNDDAKLEKIGLKILGSATQLLKTPQIQIAFAGQVQLWQDDQTIRLLAGYYLGNQLNFGQSDGQYASVSYNQTGLELAHDPFGARRIFYWQTAQSLWFASELRFLLAVIPNRELNLAALHTYLAFSFAAAPYTLIKDVQVVPANQSLLFSRPNALPQASLLVKPRKERLYEEQDEKGWANQLQIELEQAVNVRLKPNSSQTVGLHLSGGFDSSLVGAYLVKADQKTQAFYLDFGPPYNLEQPYAEQTATALGLNLINVVVKPKPKTALKELYRMVWRMGEAWGDPVTLPLYLGYEAVRQAGLTTVFNGEGGDQLFAGWPNRPMLAAEIYGDAGYAGYDSRVQSYLQTFHHFYGQEAALYGSKLKQAAGNLSYFVEPYLNEPALPALFDQLRWTNYWLKGSQNILPRAAILSRGAGLTMQTPLFDRRLACFALNIPLSLLMRGTDEKYIVKQAIGGKATGGKAIGGKAIGGLLPTAILERPKRGMGVPVTEWWQTGLQTEFKGLLAKLARRDVFNKEYLKMLSKNEDAPTEIRRHRRLGEKIWQLCILEIWLQLFYDKITLQEP